MKKLIISGCSAIIFLITSCNKADNSNISSADLTTQLESQKAISVGTAMLGSTNSQDSIYAIQTCNSNERLLVVDFVTLSTNINTYLSTNYSGYTAIKAAQITDVSNTITGYIVVINYNSIPVAIKFDAQGAFVKVLELRQGIDIIRHERFHHGGCFDDRDGLKRDTVALSSLSSTISNYLATTYATDVLVKAFITKDSSTVVITNDANGIPYANVFNASGVFVNRFKLSHRDGRGTSIAQDSLPANITAYLTTTYTGYTFKHAFSISKNGVLQGYILFIDANNSKYAVEFDASGNFLAAHIIK